MQIKQGSRDNDEERDGSGSEVEQDPDLDNGVPIWSSLESLLIIPPSMKKPLSEAARRTQALLDRFSNNRRILCRKFEKIADELDDWEKGCAISTTIGSSVGVAGGFAVVGGLIFMPPVAIAGLIVSTAAGASNLITGIAKTNQWNKKIRIAKELFEQDKKLFEELLESREELMAIVKEILDSEENQKQFENDSDVLNNLKSILGASVFGASGLATRFAVVSMGRLSSSLVKGVLHSAAVIGIIIDSVTLYLSAKDLNDGAISKLGEELRETAGKFEIDRQKVFKSFLNQDVWDDKPEQEQENHEDQLETMSDTGSFEYMSDHRATTAGSEN